MRCFYPIVKETAIKRIIQSNSKILIVSCLLTGATPQFLAAAPEKTGITEATQPGVAITGKVVDEKGEPLIGVSIKIKGTSQGISTDVNGNFKLTVPANGTLLINYVGYESREIPVNNQKTFRIELKETSSALDEVVVVGYGTVRKRDLTGSVGSVGAETITARGTTSVMGALQGSVAGVNIATTSAKPGASFNIQIRGQNSINADGSKPLYVVDGIVMDNIDWLNPADIEKIDILKDASSTAIYGSRGSSGVVLVSTKSSAVSSVTKTTVSYDGFYGVRDIVRIPDFMDGREWIDMRTANYYQVNAATGAISLAENNQAVILQNSKVINQRLYDQTYTDWLKLGTRQGQQQNHFINIAGIGNAIAYNLGAGYQNEKGNFVGENLDKYTLKVAVNNKVNKKLTLGATANLAHQNIGSGSQNGYQDLFRMSPVLAAYAADGSLIRQPGIASVIEGSGNFTSSGNPLFEIESGNQENRRFDILGSAFVQYAPIEGLEFKSTFMPRFNRTREGYFYGVTPERPQSVAYQENRESFEYTWDNQVTYRKTIAKDHSINATLINSFYKTRYEMAKLNSNNLPYDSGWYNMGLGTLITSNTGSLYTESALLSYAARVNYDYKGKYLLTGTVRWDGSSKLADKWAAFPSMALAWRIKQEDFFKAPWVSDLKARFSFGYSGSNSGINPYGSLQTPRLGTLVMYDYGDGKVVSGAAPGIPVNPNITWEKTRELNAGIDFGFFNQRLYGTVDLYNKLSDGLLMSRKLALESGAGDMTDNIGSVRNKGIEVSLTSVNVRSSNWNWTTTVNFAYNQNKIENLANGVTADIGNARFVGSPINVIYDYKIAGIWKSDQAADARARNQLPGQAIPVDVNKDGVYNGDDRTVLGQVDPKWTANFTSTVSFKNWDLGVNLYGRFGTFVSDNFLAEFSPAATQDRGRPKINIDYFVPGNVAKYDWSQWDMSSGSPVAVWGTTGAGNENAALPLNRLAGAFWGNNGRYTKADFVKIRNITLGYTFGAKALNKMKLGNLRVYANVLNPFTITNYKGWDPEYATTSLTNGNGPSTVIYQFGVNLKF